MVFKVQAKINFTIYNWIDLRAIRGMSDMNDFIGSVISYREPNKSIFFWPKSDTRQSVIIFLKNMKK